MTRHRPVGVACLVGIAVAAAAIAGCAGSSHAGARPQRANRPAAVPLAAGGAEPSVSWATVQTGGPSVGGRFWQLLTEDQATGRWRLATPPGVADNAGLAVTGAPDGTMTAGFVPSDLLRFSPLATSTDDGGHWAQGLLPAGLAPDPDALAALPHGRLVAVTTTAVEESTAGAKSWTPLVTLRALAATPAGRRCGLTGLTGTAGRPDGSVLVSGTCSRPGRLGLFSNAGGSWQVTGPALPNPVAPVLPERPAVPLTVLGLMSSAAGTSALFGASSPHGPSLIPAWLPAGATTWSAYQANWGLYQSMTAGHRRITSVAGSAGGVWAVTLTGGRGLATGPATQPRHGPAVGASSFSLPGPDATIVPSASGTLTALVPGVSAVTVWQRTVGGSWQRTQTIDVASAPAGQSS